MPADSTVALTVWRDATDWPEGREGQMFPTDLGCHFYNRNAGGWCEEGDPYTSDLEVPADLPLDPQPSVWCDPTPPGEDALTVGKMRHLVRYLERHTDPEDEAMRDIAARLRRALEQIGTP